MNVFEIFGKLALEGQENVKKELTDVEKMAAKVSTALKITGAVFTAVGVAGLKMVSDARQVNATLASTAITLGTTSQKLREITLATTNAGFTVADIAKTFDVLVRSGVRNTEELQKSAEAFDALADATGGEADTVASQLIPVFKLFGIELPQTSAELDKFTWLAKNTSITIDEFASAMTRLAPEMKASGTSIDDAQMALAILSERGIIGRAAISELNDAVMRSIENHTTLATEIRATAAEMNSYETSIKEATGLTDKHAAAMETQITFMDKVKQKFSEITLAASGFLTPLEPILALMTALGPILLFFSTQMGIATIRTVAHTAAVVAQKIAVGAVTAAQWLWNIAMGANPVGAIILGIAALITITVLLIKNWENVKLFFSGAWSYMKEGFSALAGFILTAFRAAFNGIGVGLNWLIGMLNKINFSFPDWIPNIGGKSFGINIPPLKLPEWANGGVINQPSVISRLSDMKPYAIAGEAGPETVSPMRGFNAANITVLLDGRVLMQALAPLMVGEIRLVTGTKD